MADERRRYLRVLFEETIQVEAGEWTDPMVTGLDISLNGTRFHCEHSLTEGANVNIVFRPDLKMEGIVRWCWPIEWYYQAAVEFVDITADEQARLRTYISETTGEPYPEYSEAEETETEETETETEELSLEEDDLFAEDISIEDDLRQEEGIFTGTLTPLVFANKRVIIVDDDENRVETISQYLSKRNQFEIGHTDKKSHLWPLLKAQPADLIILSWGLDGEDGLEMLRNIQERSPNTPVIFLAGPISLEERLEGLNEGAMDFITRPVSLSSISQSILKTFASMELSSSDGSEGSDEEDFGLDGEDEIELSDDFLDEDLDFE